MSRTCMGSRSRWASCIGIIVVAHLCTFSAGLEGAVAGRRPSHFSTTRRALFDGLDTRACHFGSTPASWVRTEWPEVPGRGTDQHAYSRLDDSDRSVWLRSYKDDDGVPFGSARLSIDPACPFENLILPFLKNERPMDKPVTILWLGDSLDAQTLDYVCLDYIRRGGQGWFAFLRSHDVINYCYLPNGLSLVQVYATRGSLESDLQKTAVARAFFNGDDSAAMHRSGGEDPADTFLNRTVETPLVGAHEPDLVIVGGVFWPLHHYAGQHRGEQLLPVLPMEQVYNFVSDTTTFIRKVKEAFPNSHVVTRNSPEITTDCSTGSHIPDRKRTWGLRSYVDQLNNAMSLASVNAGVEMVNMKGAADTFQPTQLTTDGVHPRGWFQMEQVNMYLNMIKQRRTYPQ